MSSTLFLLSFLSVCILESESCLSLHLLVDFLKHYSEPSVHIMDCVTYGSETWKITKKDESVIQVWDEISLHHFTENKKS